MENLLVGNGLIIQYGGDIYNNSNIINRTMKNAREGRYEEGMKKTLPPEDAYSFLKSLKREIYNVIDGDYDKYALFPSEKATLADFKVRYPYRNININHVGFEDYFIVLRLIFNRFKESREVRSGAITGIKRLFLDAIYNNGDINDVYKNFPKGITNFFNEFDNVFTTNYDLNIENISGRIVMHLHGQFNVLEDVYDENSLRNMLSDKPAKNINIDDSYKHTYCNAIMDSAKDFQFEMYNDANSAILKFAKSMQENPDLNSEIASWRNDKNKMLNAYESIILKSKNPDIKFGEYFLPEFENISGNITILGLSPNNDMHLLKRIKNNYNLHNVKYYYFNDKEADNIREYFDNKQVICYKVKELWKSFEN